MLFKKWFISCIIDNIINSCIHLIQNNIGSHSFIYFNFFNFSIEHYFSSFNFFFNLPWNRFLTAFSSLPTNLHDISFHFGPKIKYQIVNDIIWHSFVHLRLFIKGSEFIQHNDSRHRYLPVNFKSNYNSLILLHYFPYCIH